jgi:uncharacterized membrane protein YphA (DoxX/SURF4 family)
MPNPILIFLANVSRWGVGLVFIVAGISKILNPEEFMRAIGNFNLLPLFLVPVSATTLPWLELLGGFCLIIKRFVKSSSLIIAALLVIFIAAMIINILKGVQTDCGCFGLLFADSSISIFSIFRNVVLFGLTCYIIWIFPHDSNDSRAESYKRQFAVIFRTTTVSFVLFLLVLSIYQLMKSNILGEKYSEAKINLSRLTGETQQYRAQIANYELEKRLLGITVPKVYIEKYLKHNKTLVLLATSHDCSPCTETELNVWKEYLNKNKPKFNVLCLYYNYNENQYGKYEDVYKSLLTFEYDHDKLYEFLKINDTPIALLIDTEGNIVNAHRPDPMQSEKTKIFLEAINGIQ